MAKNKKNTKKDKMSSKGYVGYRVGEIRIPSKKDNMQSLGFWGGSVPSYVRPNKRVEDINFRNNLNVNNSLFNSNVPGALFRPLIPVPQKILPNKQLKGYNFNLGPAQNPLIIQRADSRLRGKNMGGSDIFRLTNDDPFNTRRKIANKGNARMKDIRWIDMVANKKYKKYTANPFSDSDRDGVLNIFDCRPGNKWYQDEMANGAPDRESEAWKAIFEEVSPSTLNRVGSADKKYKKIYGKKVDGFNTEFNSDGTPRRGSGGRPPQMYSKGDIETERKEKARVEKLLNQSFKTIQEDKRQQGITARKELAIKAQESKQLENLDKQKKKDENRARKEAILRDRIITANKKLDEKEKDRLRKENKDQERSKERNIETKYIQEKMDIQKKKASKGLIHEQAMMYKAKAKASKAEIKAAGKRKPYPIGSAMSLSQNIQDAKLKGAENIMRRKNILHRTENRMAELASTLEVDQKKYEDIAAISSLRNKEERVNAANLFKETYGENYKDAKLLSKEEDKQMRESLLKAQYDIKRDIKDINTVSKKEARKQKILGVALDVSKDLDRVTGGKLRRKISSTIGAAYKDLGKEDMALSRKITQRAKLGIGGLFSMGGIGGVGGDIISGYRGGQAYGDDSRLYGGKSFNEAQYAAISQQGGPSGSYFEAGDDITQEQLQANWKGAGRPEGTYKYGMPINEYKAMKREQEQAMRIQEALREQAMTKQLTSESQVALGLAPSSTGSPAGLQYGLIPQYGQTMVTGSIASDVISGRQPISPQAVGAMAVPGITIGAGMDVVSGVMNMGRKPHSSQTMFPGLHAEAKTAKIPWLATDPVMIRDADRPPVYYGDVDSAEIARNTKAYNVSSLPLGSPLVGSVGYQYAGRIKEVKAPQTKNMIMQTQNDGIVKANPTMKANPWGLMLKNRFNFSESNIVDEDLRGNVISRDQIGGNIINAPYVFSKDHRATGQVAPVGMGRAEIYPVESATTIGNAPIQRFSPEVTGFSVNGLYDAQRSGQAPYELPYQGNPGIASANPFRSQIQQVQQKRISQREAMSLMEAREAALEEQERLKAEEEYVKQVALQEGLKETDAMGGKGFAKPKPIFDTIKEMVMKKGPSDIEKQIIDLEERRAQLDTAAAREVEDITPGSPLPLNMMSNAKGNFEDLPVAIKQQIIEEEIYQKQGEEMQRRYNIEQSKYQADLKEQMRQAAAIRNYQLDAAKKAQMAAEQMLAAQGSTNQPISPPVEYETGEILDPYYDEYIQNQQMAQAQALQQQTQEPQSDKFRTMKRKIPKVSPQMAPGKYNPEDYLDTEQEIDQYVGSGSGSAVPVRGFNPGSAGVKYG